jgi:hypothetical protein
LQGKGTLVALIAKPNQRSLHCDRAANYLHLVAQRARMRFQITERSLVGEAPNVSEIYLNHNPCKEELPVTSFAAGCGK